jgi:DNA-binding response OmpR family regulator
MAGTIRGNGLSALLVGEYEGDRFLIHGVFKRFGWRLFEARSRRRAMKCLERNPVQVVIAESDVPNWNWKRVLNDLRNLAKPPQLIVTSRTADEALWAEVLNIGGYDVMAQPFQEYEVERVIASAHRHFDYQPFRAHHPLRAATHTA